MPRRNDTKPAMPLQRVVKRNVVNADDSEKGVNADALEFLQKRIGNCDLVRR
jgi:hypothetical protein